MKQIERKTQVYDQQAISAVWRIPDNYDGERAVILAHGAGNDMHSEFLSSMHEHWSDHGVMTIKFNFLYKEKGGKLPDRPNVLMDTWRAIADSVTNEPELAARNLFYAGKSLGGRIASMLAAGEANPAGLIFLGYPLHPAGKPEKLRIDHLSKIRSPMLFIQGTRDPLCDLNILDKVLKDLDDGKNQLHRIEGGDHSFRVLKKFKRETADVYDEIARCALDFTEAHTRQQSRPYQKI